MKRIDTLQLFWLLILTAGLGYAFIFAAELDELNRGRLAAENEAIRDEIDALRQQIDISDAGR